MGEIEVQYFGVSVKVALVHVIYMMLYKEIERATEKQECIIKVVMRSCVI